MFICITSIFFPSSDRLSWPFAPATSSQSLAILMKTVSITWVSSLILLNVAIRILQCHTFPYKFQGLMVPCNILYFDAYMTLNTNPVQRMLTFQELNWFKNIWWNITNECYTFSFVKHIELPSVRCVHVQYVGRPKTQTCFCLCIYFWRGGKKKYFSNHGICFTDEEKLACRALPQLALMLVS